MEIDTPPSPLPWAQKLGEGGQGFVHFLNYCFLNGTSWAVRGHRPGLPAVAALYSVHPKNIYYECLLCPAVS